MASIDRLSVEMQHEIMELLNRAEQLNHEINEISAKQWWILRQVDESQLWRDKVEGESIVFSGYRFRQKPRPKPRPGSVDLSDTTLYDT